MHCLEEYKIYKIQQDVLAYTHVFKNIVIQ